MTVHQLQASPVPGCVAAADAAIDDALAADAWMMTDGELEAAVVAAARLEARVAALRLDLAAEADRREAAAASGAAGTAAWLGRLTGDSRSVAAGGLRLGRLLGDTYAATRTAFASGRVNVEQVRVILNAAERLPSRSRASSASCVRRRWSPRRPAG